MPRPSGEEDWRDNDACRSLDPDLFFPIGNVGPAHVQIAQADRSDGG